MTPALSRILSTTSRRRWFVLALLSALCGAAQAQSDESAKPELQRITHTLEDQIAALRPVLIGKPYLDEARRKLAVQLARMSRDIDRPNAWMADNALVVRDFIGDVQVVYALVFREGTQLVSWGAMRAWGMDPDRLHQRALANLAAFDEEIRIKPVGKLPWLNVVDADGGDDGDAASRVLLHWRWSELTLRLGESLLLGMPTRDVVVFTSTLEPERIAQMRETVATIEAHQGRPISRMLFLWTPQGWREYE